MKINKVSGKAYHVLDGDEVVFHIKRKNANHYTVVKMGEDDSLGFVSLQDAKKYVRAYQETWQHFFRRHTQNRIFKDQKESNEHMREVAKIWKEKLQLKQTKS